MIIPQMPGLLNLSRRQAPKRSKKIKVDRDILTARERSRSQSRKDDNQGHKESDDIPHMPGLLNLPRRQAPKRSKKIKVDRHILTARERSRS